MFTYLIDQLQLPERFTPSEKMFWQDSHISTYLLEAHLDPGHEGASRTADFIDQSVAFITQTAAQAETETIIDFGCGPGLYCERLAEAGYQVTGIDFSERSIQHAKASALEKGLNITYRYDNYLTATVDRQYDLATLIYCDYGALSPGDRKQLLRRIWNSLQKGGRLLFDVFTIAKYQQFIEGKDWMVHEGGFWSPQTHVKLTQNVKYDEDVSLEQTTIITNETVESYYIWHQYFAKTWVIQEIEDAGFTLIDVYNDVTGAPYQAGNETLALLVEKDG
ncbi:class I SAM-dependent methyltransferase [Gracilibacillus timonensis]|uniref:class I SAM-dependent methyltransferase n=1 Tax=Gracilibacillus timonensis TaxID=1816696 RepID=UPI00082501B5|nr:class I SAM-dependent methyltransferase [Gracilibacillus timonensis]